MAGASEVLLVPSWYCLSSSMELSSSSEEVFSSCGFGVVEVVGRLEEEEKKETADSAG